MIGARPCRNTVRAGRNQIFLAEQLEDVRERVQQAQHGDAGDVGAIGADAILHHRALLALDPRDDGRESDHHDEQDEERLDDDFDRHLGARLGERSALGGDAGEIAARELLVRRRELARNGAHVPARGPVRERERVTEARQHLAVVERLPGGLDGGLRSSGRGPRGW